MKILYTNYGYDLVLLSDGSMAISQNNIIVEKTGIQYSEELEDFVLDFFLYDYVEDQREKEELEGYFS